MYTIRGIFHNFKEFYNDINGATLTGAIDVVVVEQPNGSFNCSPFHVRFGKLGVLRSKEKVVDIEINGEPVDIHMKLGESGEAFFVEDVPETEGQEIPEHLATSPIPVSHFEELYNSQTSPTRMDDSQRPVMTHIIKARRRKSFDLGDKSSLVPLENQVNDYTKRRYTGEVDTEKIRERNFLKRQISLGNIDIGENSVEDLTLSVHSAKHNSSDDTSKDNDISETIFKMDSLEMDLSKSESNIRIEIEPPKTSKVEVIEPASEPKSGKKKRRKKSLMKKKNSQRKVSNVTDMPPPLAAEVSISESTQGSTNDLKSSDSTTDQGSLESNSEHDLKELKCEIEPISTCSSRKVPLDPEFHFFSDTELTTGQQDSRPNTPIHIESVQSDTEFEVQKSKDEGKESQRQSWAWGEFPKTEGVLPQSDDPDMEKEKRESMLSSMFSFMKQNKHRRQHSNTEGVYLADISSGAIDPEIAALYFTSSNKKKNNDADMDCESGNGPSLTQSPNSAEGSKSIDSDFDEQNKAAQTFMHDISLSMCGWEPEPNEDSFIRNVVAFSDLCNNPSLLESPNLVVRIRDKYYNWKVAVPIISSLLIYQRPLPQSTVDQLVSLHMPQNVTTEEKEPIKQEYRSWWSGWTRKRVSRETTPAPDAVNPEQTKDKTTIITVEEETVVANLEVIGPESKPIPITEEEKKNDSSPEHSPKSTNSEKCRKTLRLTSEQIARLNLRDGMNEIEFSVTTAYQGTSRCKCHLYKWRWDDKIVISDIDGTITKSDVLGHILPIVGKDWAQSGVAQLFNKIKDNGYKLLYLSARAIGQARITREYLKSIKQGDLSMPDGPMLLNPTSLITAFHSEVIEKKPEQFKISCMSDIRALFPPDSNPFYAGYGNRINDVWAYRAVGIPIVRIFTINPKGELKHELTQTFQSSYTGQSLVVNDVFPPIPEKMYNSEISDSDDECADESEIENNSN